MSLSCARLCVDFREGVGRSTVGGSAHPAFTDFMYGEEFYYDSNTPEETETFIRQFGCRLVIAEYMNMPDGGRNKGRYAIVAEKT